MAEEVELKLALAEDHQARFLRHPLLKQALARHVETLDNIYYDTADLSLRRRGIGLRLRRKGRLWLQTVKQAGASHAGLSSRPEWEGPYSGHFDFSEIDDPTVREWLQRPKLLTRIVPICETRFRRITWTFAAAPGTVLLTLDRGWIIANGCREAISEVELELAGAPVHAIFALAAQLAQRVALTPSVLSKAERGYRLHLGTPRTPIKAATVALSAALPPFEAFRRIALSCLEHLQQNHHGALNSDDPEYIHQMRVATRRLRAALRLFAPVLPAGLADSLRLPFAALMTCLGRARDLDVLLAEIANPVLTALPNEPRLPALAGERAEVERLVALCGQVELAGPDARTEQLVELFREQIRIDNEPGKKFLVFTEFTATQAMLAEHLQQRGFEVSLLNGSMDLAQRQAAQSAFRGPAQVLIATDAGGEGLNLQFAHVIINYDLPWAPMRVEQRIGRVDRIGQKREVRAFNLVLRNSVEERLYDIWQHKLATILAEYGVDKTGDVLDSSEAEAQFERLARTAILQPATFDNELDKVLTELRKAAAKASETKQLYQGAVAAEDKVPALPLKAWLETVRGQAQVSLLAEADDTDFSAELLERVRALRPYAAPDRAAVVLDVTGMGFEVEGWLALFKLALGHQAIRQQRVFALVVDDAGQVFVQAGQRLWDALAARRVEVSLGGSVAPPDAAWLEQLAEQQAAEDFELLLERTRSVAEQRLSAECLSAARRRDAFARLADPTVRALRLRQLEKDHAERANAIRAAAEEMPALECLLVARVRAR